MSTRTWREVRRTATIATGDYSVVGIARLTVALPYPPGYEFWCYPYTPSLRRY
jgi:hypothetical protein